jgi:hypothetical protein
LTMAFCFLFFVRSSLFFLFLCSFFLRFSTPL